VARIGHEITPPALADRTSKDIADRRPIAMKNLTRTMPMIAAITQCDDATP
jgi:hypothetical protein